MKVYIFCNGLFLFWLQFKIVWSTESPVLLWGANSPSKPALTLIQQNEFANLMKPLFNHNAVVTFLEPNLTTKDFLCRNDTTGISCYSSMTHVKPRSYYARVQNPLKALESIAVQIDSYNFGESRYIDSLSLCHVGKLTIIKFNQSITDRNKRLHSHDSTIANISSIFKCPIVYIYTSMSSLNSLSKPVVRRRRGTEIVNQIPGTLFHHHLFTLFLKEITLLDNHKRTTIELASMDVHVKDNHLSVVFGTELHFNVKIEGGYYIINEFVLRGEHYRAFDVETPFKMSYFCGNLELINKKKKLIFQNLQFQGDHKNINPEPVEKFKFYDPWHCVGFFTPPILSGIFVVAIIIYITSIGICWLMDVNSNDRFDDPTKEPIKINFED